MATLILSFEEIGGIEEFNGLMMAQAVSLIMNKAADRLLQSLWHGCDDENFVDYRNSGICFVSRRVFFTIRLRV